MSWKSTELDIISTIEEITSPKGAGQLNSIGDDCAVLRQERDTDLVVTKDCMVEGVHFDLSYTMPHAIGRKLAISNLSDIGAAGATPRWALLALGFQGSRPIGFYKGILDGLVSTLANFGVTLVGGDTVSSPMGLFFCLTLMGTTPKGQWLSRGGARSGDIIFSSGPLGDSMAGLILLRYPRNRRCYPYGIKRYLIRKHLFPTYPHLLGRALLQAQVASSAIDTSDGIAKDLRHISEKSKVACIIKRPQLPLSRPARYVAITHGMDPNELTIKGGEDYALIWTTPRKKAQKAREIASSVLGHPPYEIGHIEEGTGLYMEDTVGRRHKIEALGYVHS